MKILHLITRLDYHSAARQLLLLTRGLPRPLFETLVCVVGSARPFAPLFHAAGIPIEVLGWGRVFDLRPILQLRRVLQRFGPDVIHAWEPAALRWLRMAGGTRSGPVVFSALRAAGRLPGPADRWLLRRTDCVLALGTTELDDYRRVGVKETRLAQASLAVDPPAAAATPALPADIGVPPGKRYVACMGALERHKCFRDAIWAFDILRFLYDDLHLVLIGDGPDRRRLEQFVRNTQGHKVVHLIGDRVDGPAVLAGAELIWVPGHVDGGCNVTLEAMAAGRPVVASRLASLAEIVVDGETGFLVPPGNQAELARRARELLDNAALGRGMGEAGRQRAAKRFAVGELARRAVALYQGIV